MTLLGKANAGSSTLEFIFCAPLLVILMFVALDVNERIEHRVTATIAAGNAAWITKPDAHVNNTTEELAKADVLGTRGAESFKLGIQAGATLDNADTVLSYTPEHRNTNAYILKILREFRGDAVRRAHDRARQKISATAKMDDASSKMATAMIAIGDGVRSLWSPALFPSDQSVEEQQLTWSLSALGTTNLALQTIQGLANSVGSDTGRDLPNMQELKYRVLAHKSHYLRRDPAYHPEKFSSEFLFGIVLGSSGFDSFNERCFMWLDEAQCDQHNGFYDYLRTRFYIVKTIKSVASCNFTNPISAAQSLAFGIVLGLLEDKAESLINDAISSMTGAVVEELMKSLPQVDLSQTIQGKIKDAAAEAQNELEDKLGDTIDSIGGGP